MGLDYFFGFTPIPWQVAIVLVPYQHASFGYWPASIVPVPFCTILTLEQF